VRSSLWLLELLVMIMFLETNVRDLQGINTVGVDMADPYAQDDIVVKELHIQKGKRFI
jgi:hypothetical protein